MRAYEVYTTRRPTSTTTALSTASHNEEVRVQKMPRDAQVECHGMVKVQKVPRVIQLTDFLVFGDAFSGLEQAAKRCLKLAVLRLGQRAEQSSSAVHDAREDSYRPVLSRSGKFRQGLPNAWKEAEEAEGTKWSELSGSMLALTPTPMGALLAAQPGIMQLLGAGRRAATWRSRLRAVKRFLDGLAVSHAEGHPTELHDDTGI